METQPETQSESYCVVVNAEAQYSIWPSDLAIPTGWDRAGPTGPKQECLTWIASEWKDMRPLSLRQHLTTGTPIPTDTA